MSLHVGVLGTGGWCRVHLTALAASPYVARVTLAGRNAQALAEWAARFPVVSQTTTDLHAVLADPGIDLVHIVLPHFLHAPLALAALAAGKHVICEKPAATTLADFDAMIEAATAHNRRLLVVMNQLYNPVFRQLKNLVEAGEIGRPFLSVENSYRNAAANYRRDDYWRNSIAEAGGGVLIDGGYHMVYRHLDTLASLGTPGWVVAETAQLAVRDDGLAIPAKGEDFVSATVGFPGPLRIQWAHGWTLAADPARGRQSFLAGTNGTLELTDQDSAPLVLHQPDSLSSSGPAIPATTNSALATGRSRAIDVEPGPRTGTETTHACLLDYLECIATECEPAHASIGLARRTLATICAIYAAGASGKRETVK